MSTQTSPRSGSPTAIDKTNLPSGQCRYILLNPEIKGHRCACVGFTLNRALPSVTCECGHLSCYHIKAVEQSVDKVQLEQLMRRVQLLEEQLDREKQGGLGSALGEVIGRLGDVEEQLEKSKEEIGQETRAVYRQITGIWHSLDESRRRQMEMSNRLLVYDDRLDQHDTSIQEITSRLMESNDAAIELEERVEHLERLDDVDVPSERRRRTSSPESDSSKNSASMPHGYSVRQGDSSEADATSSMPMPMSPVMMASTSPSVRTSSYLWSGPWTVHVSLLPTGQQPFPFEKDTTAYKRCLSRGLHRMIAVQGTDSESFIKAVSNAFAGLLRGRSWVPLQARLCDAATLLGLPMLRPLDPALVGNHYDVDFLRKHCAVCGPNGKIDSLYIAMESDKLSWHFLRRSPCYLEGLEDAWDYDTLLDRNDFYDDDDIDEENRPSAADILPMPNLKRAASEISQSRTPSFSSGSTGEGEGSRPKVARTCIPVPMELHRRVETV